MGSDMLHQFSVRRHAPKCIQCHPPRQCRRANTAIDHGIDTPGYPSRFCMANRQRALYAVFRVDCADAQPGECSTMKLGIRAVLVVPVVLAANIAFAQTTGVSHPDQVPVTTSPEGIAQPVIYENPAPPTQTVAAPVLAAPILKERITEPPQPPTEKPVLEASVTPAPLNDTQDDAALARASDLPRRLVADPDAGIVTRVPGAANELPVGTLLKFRLNQHLTTDKTPIGAEFTAELDESVIRDGRVLLPAGSLVTGKVTDVHGGRRISGAASIHLEPRTIQLPDGTRYRLQAEVIDTGIYRNDKVDSEGTIIKKDHAKGTLAAMGLATGSGMAAGAVFGSWPGAIIGGAIGAGVSTVMWLKEDRQADFPEGTEITVMLTKSVTVGQ